MRIVHNLKLEANSKLILFLFVAFQHIQFTYAPIPTICTSPFRHLSSQVCNAITGDCITNYTCSPIGFCIAVNCSNYNAPYCGPNNTCQECLSNENCTTVGYICDSSTGNCINNMTSSTHNTSSVFNSSSSAYNSSTHSNIHNSSTSYKEKSTHSTSSSSSPSSSKSNINNASSDIAVPASDNQLSNNQKVIVGSTVAAGVVAVGTGGFAAYKLNCYGVTRVTGLLKSCCCAPNKMAARMKRLSDKKKEKELDEF